MDKKYKKDSKEDEYRTFRVEEITLTTKQQKRLLELAKKESIKIGKARESDKPIYNRSLPKGEKIMGDLEKSTPK